MPSLSTAEDTNPFGPQTIENDNSNSTDVLWSQFIPSDFFAEAPVDNSH
jgi:hypothetical protein